ncbi:hypothetical protein R76727_04436 [Ralstonia mannitolilytica]|nr:hypothetical protein R76727_04436 [Ralstonia mannitolilytica]
MVGPSHKNPDTLLILRRIFDRNQQEFTAADPKTIPTIAVVEEAQSVLNENAPAAEPYVAWVKEGRKYDLGALLITQQPGSIPVEILSQGDNWFIFHLLSAADLTSLKRANAHFSDDLLSSLLNEPIPGQGVFWSSVGGKPYPVSLRALSFEKMFSMRDHDYNQPAGNTYAQTLRSTFSGMRQMAARVPEAEGTGGLFPAETEHEEADSVDVMAAIERRAIEALQGNDDLRQKLESQNGMPWYGVQQFLIDHLPEHLEDRRQFAYNLVSKAMNAVFGPQPTAWETFKNPGTGKTWIRVRK